MSGSPKISKRQSKIDRSGVFADEFIPKRTVVAEYTGEKISSEETERRERINDLNGTTYVFILDDIYCIDGAVGGNISKYINHSCDPNLEVEITNGRIYFLASRDIQKDEELSYDYAYDYDPDFPCPCRCGSPKCRGTINEPPSAASPST